MVEGTRFRELAYAVTAGSDLALEMGDVELIMADIRLTIEFSHLKARKVMVRLVRECIADVKNVTRGLQRLTSKVGGVVDRYAYAWYFLPLPTTSTALRSSRPMQKN